MIPNQIEIKANIDGDVSDALSDLGRPDDGVRRRIWFAEDRSGAAVGDLKMFTAGVILRVRSGGGEDDSTVKLRPVDQERLVGDWSAPFREQPMKYRIEGDWSGDRRSLASSAEVAHRAKSIPIAVSNGDFGAMFTPRQRELVEACVRIRVELGQLVALGPVSTTKWEGLRVARDVPEVNAERWTVQGLDFLELSIRVKARDDESVTHFQDRAADAQERLVMALNDRGVHLSEDRQSKTEKVLKALVGAACGCSGR